MGGGGQNQRGERIRAWAAEREREKYGSRGVNGEGVEGKMSSEDVWEARRWMVRGAFGRDWGLDEGEAGESAVEDEGS